MKVRSNGRVYRSETEWRAILADYQESGSSQAEYCRRHGIALQSFSKAMSRYANSVNVRGAALLTTLEFIVARSLVATNTSRFTVLFTICGMAHSALNPY